MTWTHLDLDCASKRTWQRKIAAGEIPSKLDGEGRRLVWIDPAPTPGWTVELEAKIDLLLERVEGQAPALKGEVLSPPPQSKRPAQRRSEPRPVRPADASDVPGWQTSWEQLVRREGSISGAGRLLGVGQPAASRWTSGRRKPQPQTQRRIVEMAAQIDSGQGDVEQNKEAA